METVSLSNPGLYDPRRAGALRRAETVVSQVHTLMDVFARQDEGSHDIRRDEPGRVALCDHQAVPGDHPWLMQAVELDGNLSFQPKGYQTYSPNRWKESAPQAEFHALVQVAGNGARVDYTSQDEVSRYKLEWTNDPGLGGSRSNEVVLDRSTGTLTVLGGELGFTSFVR